ncbi:MAG: NAD(P)/FAD-dependent oxidoreductase [Spongiibacteraceae bacterium]
MNNKEQTQDNTLPLKHYDSVIIGAGFGGIRAAYEMQKKGLSSRLFEAGSDVGGTWYWNRYPGARTDTESWGYCFFFSQELNEEWDWDERMPTWDQVQKYMVYAVDRLDLRKNMQFNTRVQSAHYDEANNLWTVTTQQGESVTCQYLISAVGWFEEPCKPAFKGIDNFKGEWYVPSRWPKEPVDFAGKKVGIIGSGSTAVQILTSVAHTAEHVTMFQRTPNYVMPGRNYPVDKFEKQFKKKNFQAIIEQTRKQVYAFPMVDSTIAYDDVDEAERQRILEAGWEAGGFRFIFETFSDITVNEKANEAACEFFRNKIRSIVKDPATAELLCPDYYIALKRPPVSNFYYESFNRPNVSLVDVSKTAIDEILPNGVKVGDSEYDFDILVFAMGFDAVTGPLMNLDVRGRNGLTIKEKWQDGPHTHLGIVMDDFPNMFIITGPQTPFSNVPPVVESSVTWIGQLISHMKQEGYDSVEGSPQAVAEWTTLMKTLVDQTLMRDSASQRAWFMGANIPGKPHAVLFYFGGAGAYFDEVDKEADAGFPSLVFSKASAVSSKTISRSA